MVLLTSVLALHAAHAIAMVFATSKPHPGVPNPPWALCRRLYDCLVALLDEKGAKFSDIRRILERGMKTGAVSLMKDVRGSVVAVCRMLHNIWVMQWSVLMFK